MEILDKLFKGITTDYALHTRDLILPVALTAMMWQALQSLINEGAKAYLPSLAVWQIATIEIFVASYGLWAVTREKKKNGSQPVQQSPTEPIAFTQPIAPAEPIEPPAQEAPQQVG